MFCSQPKLLTQCGVHSSLHENCHHQISFANFNLNIFYPPPYEREVWYYSCANQCNIECIKAAICQFFFFNKHPI